MQTHPRDRDSHLPWHALPVEDMLAVVESDHGEGLTTVEARERRAQYGANELPVSARRSVLSVFVGQFKSPLIYLLFVAAGLALALGHHGDSAVIFVVVLVNSLIGALQEGRAERSLAAPHELASHDARVVRDGEENVIVPFGLGEVLALGAVASLVLWVEELRKLVVRRRERRR